MATTAMRPAQVEQVRRAEVRRVVDSLRPGQWYSAGIVRSGHPIDRDDVVRLTGTAETGPECERCGRDKWVADTVVQAGRDRARTEVLRDRWLCRACGAERGDIDHE